MAAFNAVNYHFYSLLIPLLSRFQVVIYNSDYDVKESRNFAT